MTGQMSEKPNRFGRSRAVRVLLAIVLLTLVLGTVYVALSLPTTVRVDRITEIQIDTNGDGVLDQLYNVGRVSVGRFDTGNITLRFTSVEPTPFP